VLGAAAVLGRRFTVALLDRVLDGDGSAPDGLAALEAADLLREESARPERALRFTHALIRETVYRSLLKRRRQELHARSADAIEELYADRMDEVVGLLALHCTAAGDDERALRYHRRAAEGARAIHAFEEAIEHLGAALEAVERLAAPDQSLVSALLLGRGSMTYELGRDVGAAIADMEGAIAAARAAGDPQLELQAHMSVGGFWRALDFPRGAEHHERAVQIAQERRPEALVEALARMAIYLTHTLRLRRARELADRALAVAGEQRDADAIHYARDALKLVAQQTGDLDELERLTSELESGLRGQGQRPLGVNLLYESDMLVMWALVEGATTPMARGDFERAEAKATEALEMLRRSRAVGHEPVFREALCRLGRTRGDYASALEHGRAAIAAAEPSAMGEWGAWAAATYGWTLLELRAAEPAGELLGRWARRAGEAGAIAQEIRCLALLAWADVQRGDAHAAAEHRARAQQLLAEVNARPGEAWLFGAHAYFAVARVLLWEGYPQRAEGVVAPLLAAAERFGWLENVAYGSLVSGSSRLAAGELEGAEERLRGALETASAHGFAGAEWEAHAALAQLSREQRRPEAAREHLDRASAIVERLAAGLGDDALADVFRERALAEPAPGSAPPRRPAPRTPAARG
jgi:tetratricopeptide (TPR) repeat protein